MSDLIVLFEEGTRSILGCRYPNCSETRKAMGLTTELVNHLLSLQEVNKIEIYKMLLKFGATLESGEMHCNEMRGIRLDYNYQVDLNEYLGGYIAYSRERISNYIRNFTYFVTINISENWIRFRSFRGLIPAYMPNVIKYGPNQIFDDMPIFNFEVCVPFYDWDLFENNFRNTVGENWNYCRDPQYTDVVYSFKT